MLVERDHRAAASKKPVREPWRDFYSRLVREREEALQKLTAKVREHVRAVAEPVRTTRELTTAVTPRDVRRRQMRTAGAAGVMSAKAEAKFARMGDAFAVSCTMLNLMMVLLSQVSQARRQMSTATNARQDTVQLTAGGAKEGRLSESPPRSSSTIGKHMPPLNCIRKRLTHSSAPMMRKSMQMFKRKK